MDRFSFNDEQQAVLDHLHCRVSQILAVNALAGTGKTTTLKGAAEYPLKAERVRYFVFNRRNAHEAATKFPANTVTSTAHSFAFGAPHPDGGGTMREVYAVGGRRSRLVNGSIYGPLRDLARNDNDFADRISQVRDELRCSEGRAIMAVQSVLRQYCQSADELPGPRHIAPDLADYMHRSGIIGTPIALMGTAAWVWGRMRDPFSNFPVDHGVYLKLCSLAPPRIPADTILFDEAQDASPPMLEILKAQLQHGTRLVLVGDTYQHIYDFTGAVDAMSVIRAEHPEITKTLPLTTSYRFGQEIAEVGNKYLKLMGSPYSLRGKGPEGRASDNSSSKVNIMLFRTNAALLQATVKAVETGIKVCLVGGTGDIVKLFEALGRLYNGEYANHPELGFFDDWHQLTEYSGTTVGSHIAPLIAIVEENGGDIGDTVKALRSATNDAADAQYILSTAHKAKGGEWGSVLIRDDFQKTWQNSDKNRENQYSIPDGSELALQYVACTRAQKELYTNKLLDTMQRALNGLTILEKA
jgi:hypothetical protein